jgi:hypothetical protein
MGEWWKNSRHSQHRLQMLKLRELFLPSENVMGLYVTALVVRFPVWTWYSSAIHSLVCLTTNPHHLPQRVPHTVLSTDSSSNLKIVTYLTSPDKCLCFLHRRLIHSILHNCFDKVLSTIKIQHKIHKNKTNYKVHYLQLQTTKSLRCISG